VINVSHTVTIAAPLAEAWQRLSDLAWLATVNEFHLAARFQTAQRSGAGTRLIADHGFRWLPVTYPRHIRLTPLAERTTQLTYELRGALHPRLLEPFFADRVVRAVVQRECAAIKARVESALTSSRY
jgi:hypothetical protein